MTPTTRLRQAGQPVGMGVFCPTDIDPENRVLFDETKLDWRGLPSISIKWKPSEADKARVEEAKAVALRVADIIGRPAPGKR